MATLKSGLASAKAKLATAAKRRGPLAKGDTLTFTNRLYAVVDSKGKLMERGSDDSPAIFTTRKRATAWRNAADGRADGQRVVRLDDIKGIVQ